MKKEMSLWEWLYELVNIFLEIAIEHYEKTWEHPDGDLWKLICNLSSKKNPMEIYSNRKNNL